MDLEIIHIVLGKANPDRMNGVNKVVYQLATRQAASGSKVSVWGITKEASKNFGVRNFETILFNSPKNPFRIDEALKKAIASKKNNAVFHLHGGWIPAFSSLSAIFASQGIPFVITAHGAYNLVAMKRSKWLKKLYFAFFEKGLLTRARRIHCIGESEIAGTNYIFPTNKTFLLPYGYEAESALEKEYNYNNKEFIVGFLGRLDIYTKGLDILLDAFDAFHKIEPNSKLWIIGDGKERAELVKSIASKELEEDVILWGGKFGKEKDNLLLKMDVFASPSRNEGLPATILEASSFGIPSIATHATNISKYITEYNAGIAIENENVEALTEALMFMKKQWQTDGLKQYGMHARQMVNTAFNWDNIVGQMDNLYL